MSCITAALSALTRVIRMRLRRPNFALLLGASLFALACTGTEPNPFPLQLQHAAGDDQGGLAGATLQTPLRVRIVQAGRPVEGRTVVWTVTLGGGTVSPGTSVTNAQGYAETTWQLGNTQGEQKVTATAEGLTPIEFSAFAFDAADCLGTPIALQVGQEFVTSGADASSLCVSGAPGGADYVAIVHNGDVNPTDTLSVHTFGTTTGVLASVGDALQPLLALGAASSSRGLQGFRLEQDGPVRDHEFHTRLRQRERALAPRIAAARAEFRSRSTSPRERSGLQPSFAIGTANPQVGDVVTINAQASFSCSNALNRQGRIAAIGQHSIIVHDVQNPANGFTDAEYADIAATFDTLIHPMAVENFGAPHDIDENAKAFIFYTAEVNKLTEKGSGSYVGGFYFVRDLFPKVATDGFAACPTSNEAEVFYMLVPDPTGTFSDPRSKDFVLDVTLGTIAHEYQHLINASRRMFVNDASEFEFTWLDEGLAHISEELTFFRSAKLVPRTNLDLTDVRSSQMILDAFNAFGLANLFRFEDFLRTPGTSSPYDADDNLASRGSAWHLLRYAADRRGGGEQPFWFALVNSTARGMENLENVLGEPPGPWVRDWATAVYADDFVSGVQAQFTVPTWNLRSIFSAKPPFEDGYALKVEQPAPGTVTSNRLIGGGAIYVRQTVGSGATGSMQFAVNGEVPPPFVSVRVLRTR